MKPHHWTKEQAAAVKALYAEPAGRYVLDLIIFDLCQFHAVSLDPAAHVRDMAAGARQVGGELFNAVNVPLDRLVPEGKHEPRHRPLTATERAAAVFIGGRRSE